MRATARAGGRTFVHVCPPSEVRSRVAPPRSQVPVVARHAIAASREETSLETGTALAPADPAVVVALVVVLRGDAVSAGLVVSAAVRVVETAGASSVGA